MFLELGRRKTVDAAKICGGAENAKTEPAIRKWIARFYYSRHLWPGPEARVYCSIIARAAQHMGNSICTAH